MNRAYSRFSILALALGLCLTCLSPAMAENVEYTDDSGDLKTADMGGANNPQGSVFPGQNGSPLASGNTVTINFSSGTNPYRVFGGLSNSAAVHANTVFFRSGTVTNNLYGGYDAAATSGYNAFNNSIEISDGTIEGNAIAGISLNGDAISNTVTMTGGTVNNNLYGGNADSTGNAAGNSVIIDNVNALVKNWVLGGYSAAGLSSNNSVELKSGSVGSINGGESGTGDVKDNTVTLTGGIVAGSVFGGGTWNNGRVSGNSVSITDSEVGNWVIGGYSKDGVSFGNSVAISGSSTLYAVDAGESTSGSVIGNTLNITGGNIKGGMARGGWSSSGLVSGTKVYMSGGAIYIGTSAAGGGSLQGGLSQFGNAEYNLVVMTGGSVNLVKGGSVGESTSAGDAIGNEVYISGTSEVNNVFGGQASGSGTTFGNSVIYDVTTNWILVGSIVGGSSSTGSSTANSVIIKNGIISSDIVGGESNGGMVNGNSITISGGVLSGGILGGVDNNGTKDVTNNNITITGGTVQGILFGGYSSSGNAFTDNTLNLHTSQTIAGLYNFEYLNFYLPASIGNNDTMLTVIGTADLTNGADKSSIVSVIVEPGSSALRPGDQITLIDATTLTTNSELNTVAYGGQGVSLVYEFALTVADNQLQATVKATEANPQLKSLSEGQVSGLAFVNLGSDLLLGQGLGAMSAATSAAGTAVGQAQARSQAQGGFAPFAVASAGFGRHNSGSHVDVSGFALNAGLATNLPINNGQSGSALFGLFFEAGWGRYNTFNSFDNLANIEGDGKTSYYGAGLLARYNFVPANSSHLYLEASLRIGRVKTSYNSADLGVSYETSALYYCGHVGLGYVWQISDKSSLDLSTRLLWTHQNGDKIDLLGDPLSFAAANSLRWRTGARLSYAATALVSPYAGLYFDYEFNGKLEAQTNGHAVEAPSLQGGTGIAELGLTLHPSHDLPLSIELGLQGYLGQRRGLTGSLQVKFEF